MPTQTPEGFVRSLNHPQIDFVIIADRAEVVNGKLFVMGGGFDRVFLGEDPPREFPLSFAVGVLVPWNATNQQHRLSFAIEDAEGNDIEFPVKAAGFNVGRPPIMGEGDIQRVMVAAPDATVTFPAYGTYALRVTLNDAETKKVAIYVGSAKGVQIAT